MADSTIANLPSGSPAQVGDALPIQRSSSTLRLSVQDVLSLGPILVATVALTSAQILNLNTAPVELVAGVSGKTIVPVTITLRFNFVTTPYATSGGSLQIGVASNLAVLANGPVTSDAILTQSVSSFFSSGGLSVANVGAAVPVTVTDGQACVLSDDTGDPTGGNGTLTVTMTYLLA